ncbi:MAG: helix-turn-helix domain-containing protein [Acidimicrobiales bacterium]|jgi:excisionase family DNA binding protein
MPTLTKIDSALLTPEDRARVLEAAGALEALGSLPVPVVDTMRELLELVAAGQDATVVSFDKLLTSNQAAALLGMSRPLLNKLLDEGRIPFHRNGRDRRIALSDLTAYITERDRLKRAHADAAAGYAQRRAERLAALIASGDDQ